MFFEERNSSNAMAQPLNFSHNLPDLSFMRCLLPPESVLGAQTRELATNLFLSLSAGAPGGSTLAPNRLLEPKSQPPVSVLPTFVPNAGEPAYTIPRFFLPYDARRAQSQVEDNQAQAFEQAFLPKAVDNRTQRQPYADYHLAAFQRALDHLALLGLSNNNRQSPCSVNSMLPNSCPSATNAPMDISMQKAQCLLSNSNQSVSTCQISPEPNVTITSCNQNECHRTQRVSEERRSRVIIHQIGGAEDHFSKALQNLQSRNTAPDSERNGWRSRGDSKPPQNSSSFRSNIWTVAPEEAQTDSEKIQNIADLAVEKHFEKALANFRTTEQQTPKSPLDLSCPVDSIIDVVSSPSQADNVEVQEGHEADQGRSAVRPAILNSAARSFESGISGSEASNSSPGSGCSYNPKKNWLAQYRWRKQGLSAESPSCLSCDSGESAESLKDVRLTLLERRKSHKRVNAFRSQASKEGLGKIAYRKRTSSVPCLTTEPPYFSPEAFQLNSSLLQPGGRNSTLSIIPCSSSSSSPNNAEQKMSFFSESSSDDEAPGVSMANASERTTTTAKPSCLQHQSLVHAGRLKFARRRSETTESNSTDCLLRREAASALTPEVSPTATSGFFTDSSFSLDLTLPTVSEDNLPTAASNTKLSEQRPSSPVDCQHHHQGVNAETCASKYWTIRKRAASDAHSWSCLKRSRSLAVDKMAREIPDRVDAEEVLNLHYGNSCQSEVAKRAIA